MIAALIPNQQLPPRHHARKPLHKGLRLPHLDRRIIRAMIDEQWRKALHSVQHLHRIHGLVAPQHLRVSAVLDRREREVDAEGWRDGRDDLTGFHGCEMVVDEGGGKHGPAEGVFFKVCGEPGGFHVEHTIASDDSSESPFGLSDSGLHCQVCSYNRQSQLQHMTSPNASSSKMPPPKTRHTRAMPNQQSPRLIRFNHPRRRRLHRRPQSPPEPSPKARQTLENLASRRLGQFPIIRPHEHGRMFEGEIQDPGQKMAREEAGAGDLFISQCLSVSLSVGS